MSPETFEKFETAVRAIPRFAAQTFLAAIGGTVLGSILNFIFFDWAFRNLATPLSVTSHYLQFLVSALTGALLAYAWYRWRKATPNPIVWIAPLIWLTMCARDDYLVVLHHPWEPDMNPIKHVWDNYVGVNCEGSECLGQFIATIPFLCSVGFSIAAVCLRHKKATTTRLNAI